MTLKDMTLFSSPARLSLELEALNPAVTCVQPLSLLSWLEQNAPALGSTFPSPLLYKEL